MAVIDLLDSILSILLILSIVLTKCSPLPFINIIALSKRSPGKAGWYRRVAHVVNVTWVALSITVSVLSMAISKLSMVADSTACPQSLE